MALSTLVSNPKNQHWLPQFYLRGFAVPGFRHKKNAKIWVWTKDESDPDKQKVKDVCAEEFLYSPLLENGRRCFRTDDRLHELETTIARMYPRVSEGFPDLEQAWGIKKLLSLFLATLLLRHPDELDGNRRTHSQLVAYYETFSKDTQGKPIVPPFERDGRRYPFDSSRWEEYRNADENEIRKMFSASIDANAVSLANAMFEKRWAFLCLDQPRLLTSDSPVVVKHFEEKTAGLRTPGVNVFFPISPTRMLHMTDREQNVDGFYPFPAGRAAELNFFTLGNAKRLLLCQEQPDSLLQDLDRYSNELISYAYQQRCAAIATPAGPSDDKAAQRLAPSLHGGNSE